METKNLQELPVNYKNKKRYNTGKKPIRQPIYLTWLIGALSFFAILFQKKKIEKINMEGLKPPYMILSNHMSFVDFELTEDGRAAIVSEVSDVAHEAAALCALAAVQTAAAAAISGLEAGKAEIRSFLI